MGALKLITITMSSESAGRLFMKHLLYWFNSFNWSNVQSEYYYFVLKIISGPVMVAGDHKFHPECFCCSSCSGFIGDGESYALVERSKLYW